MERDKVAALRRVAIVLSSLPDATARRLLSSFESDHQRAIRATINHLDDVDPLERRRALDGFSASIRQGRSSLAGENDAAEIVLSRVALHRDDARLADRSHGHANGPSNGEMANESSPLAFLSAVDDAAIAHRIKDEHPQTVAIVLASISARQAARLLAKLGVALRAETMRRLAKMDTPTPDVVEEIAAQLKQKLVHAVAGSGAGSSSGSFPSTQSAGGYSTDRSRTVGQAALQAILAEMNHATAGHNDVDAAYGGSGAAYSRVEYSAAHGTIGSSVDQAALRYDSSRVGSGMGRTDHASSGSTATSAASPSERGSDPDHNNNDRVARPVKSTAEIHSQLISTTPAKLREALASVDGRQALLALCGLPTATAEAVLSDLPRRQAKQIRQQIASLGMVELREIDAAKEAVAKSIRPIENRVATRATSAAMKALPATLAAA